MEGRAGALLLLYGARHTAEIAYLSNWPGTREAFLVVPREGDLTLLVQLYNHVPNARRVAITGDVRWAGARSIDAVMTAIAERSLPDGRAVGLVGAWRWHDVDSLRERFPRLRFVEAGDIVRDLRAIKSAEELAFLRTAARSTTSPSRRTSGSRGRSATARPSATCSTRRRSSTSAVTRSTTTCSTARASCRRSSRRAARSAAAGARTSSSTRTWSWWCSRTS